MPDNNIMPPILYGTAWKKERTTELVLTAFHAGFRGFDTACQPKHYAEQLVGEALKNLHSQGVLRRDYYLQTKFTPLSGQDPNQVPYDPDAPLATQVAQSFACSQQNLHTDYLDGWILHSPLDSFEQTLNAWRAMETIQQQGGTHRLGISNCYQLDYLKTLYAASAVKPSIVQNRFYAGSHFDADIRQWCNERGIVYQSFWTLTANVQALQSDTMVRIAMRYKVSPAQVLFCYLNKTGVVPLTGTTDVEHMQEDLQCFTIPLSPLDMQAIALLFSE